MPSFRNLNKIALERARLMNNEKDISLEVLYRYEVESKMKTCKSRMQRYIGDILLNIDDRHLTEAEDWIKKAIEEDKRYGMMFFLGQDHALYAELLKQKGDSSKAKEILSKSLKIFKECGAAGWVEKYEKELATLS